MYDYYQELIPGNFYHIFNRGISKEKIFFQQRNYFYFLRKYEEYLSDFVETYAYCLLPNHFHFLVKVKDFFLSNEKIPSLEKMESFCRAVEQFRRFFISYSMSINKQERRRGSLFIKNFKRKLILNDNDIRKTIFYIHYNPIYHNICREISDYKWSSYSSLLSNKSTKLTRNSIFELFSNSSNFVNFHNQNLFKEDFERILIE